MLYLDTAVVLTLFVAEPTSEAVERWLAEQRRPLAFSDWGLTECASALGIKLRRGELQTEAVRLLWQGVQSFATNVCEFVACAPRHQVDAQRLISRFELPLRAGDALHLAIARDAGATLVTYDKVLLDAAQAIGTKFKNPVS